MSKNLLITLIVSMLSFVSNAQKSEVANKQHKIVFQLMSEDTLVHKILMRQLNNVLIVAPDAKIEVVCHGPGINLLVTEKTTEREKIQQFKTKGIVFAACENTLREKNIPKDKIVGEAIFVPAALIEIVTRQEEGWSYIKAGF